MIQEVKAFSSFENNKEKAMDNNNAVELIKAMNFHPKALDILINTIIKQVAISGKDISDEESKNQMRSLFTSNSFLKPLAENFKALFTDKEIACLLEIYQSKLMAKMLKHSEELFNPLYKAMKEQAEEMA